MRRAVIPVLAAVCGVILCFLPPVRQNPAYHNFADQRTLFGIPNFFNVVSNLPFLFVAIFGLRAFRSNEAFREDWERVAYAFLLLGTAATTFGSAYYHAWPNNQTLFWDRLPMTIIFMSLFASILGERHALIPLLLVGVASVLVWRYTGDLRIYGMVQFFPMLEIPLALILFPPRYNAIWGIVAMGALYGLAKLLEWQDQRIGTLIPTAGHPWKHVAAGAAVFFYVFSVERRKSLWYSLPSR